MSAQTHRVTASADELNTLVDKLREVVANEVVGTAVLAMMFLIVEGYAPNMDGDGVKEAIRRASTTLSDYVDEYNLLNMEIPSNLVN